MNYSKTPLIALERELADTERNVGEIRAEIDRRHATLSRPNGAVTMRDSRLPLEKLSTAAGRTNPTAAGVLVTDC